MLFWVNFEVNKKIVRVNLKNLEICRIENNKKNLILKSYFLFGKFIFFVSLRV